MIISIRRRQHNYNRMKSKTHSVLIQWQQWEEVITIQGNVGLQHQTANVASKWKLNICRHYCIPQLSKTIQGKHVSRWCEWAHGSHDRAHSQGLFVWLSGLWVQKKNGYSKTYSLQLVFRITQTALVQSESLNHNFSFLITKTFLKTTAEGMFFSGVLITKDTTDQTSDLNLWISNGK